MTKKINLYWKYVVLIGMICIIAIQATINWTDYVKPWFDDNKGYIPVSSPQRTAILISDRERARFIRFLDAYLPEDAAIVLPPDTVVFSSQSIMQNFLFPRAILACCGSDDVLCRKCLNDPNNYILAVNSFPLPDDQPGRTFVSYPQLNNRLRGVYVPNDKIGSLSLPDPLAYGKTIPVSIKALLIDILILILLFTLGSLFVILIYQKPDWGDLVELAIPLAMGSVSWGLFLASYLGIPLNLTLVVLLYCGLVALSIFTHRFKYGSYPSFPSLKLKKFSVKLHPHDLLFWIFVCFAFVVMGVVAFISIGRGYSTGDDIINWSFKGYAMVDSGTIWAGNKWGGHVLAYPMNLQLSIGIFRLADGDVIPGSKFLYILLTFSLLLGCYRFLLKNGVKRLWAVTSVLALLLVPLILFHATIGFANLPFTVYLVLGFLYSLEGLNDVNGSKILVGSILLALAAWTRPEGLYFTIIFLLLIYLVSFLVMKTKFSLRLVTISLAPILIIPGSWILLMGGNGLSDDQIGNALKALVSNTRSGVFHSEAILVLGQYAYKTFYNKYYVLLLFALAVIAISIPLTKWHLDKFKISFAVLVLLTFILPVFMFYIASFSESDFVVFLDQSFDRAYLPALVMTLLLASLAVSNQSNGNESLNTVESNNVVMTNH